MSSIVTFPVGFVKKKMEMVLFPVDLTSGGCRTQWRHSSAPLIQKIEEVDLSSLLKKRLAISRVIQ
jgi:hypothetical protein